MIDIKTILEKHGISTKSWGTGSAKTIEHLQKELNSGESILIDNEGVLIRQITVLYIDVFCEFNGSVFRLKEDKQVFIDGRERKRDYLTCSMAEKLKANETPDKKAVARAISEELGVNLLKSIKFGDVEIKEQESPSYPCLNTKLTIHKLIVELDESEFKPNGYVEVQEDKSTFFVWDKQ